MGQLSITQKIEAIKNGMETYKFPIKYFIKPDEIKGDRFAIASKGEFGAINIHSRYMTYDEFNSYLFGYYDAKSKKF